MALMFNLCWPNGLVSLQTSTVTITVPKRGYAAFNATNSTQHFETTWKFAFKFPPGKTPAHIRLVVFSRMWYEKSFTEEAQDG
jgi:hypothetical protein